MIPIAHYFVLDLEVQKCLLVLLLNGQVKLEGLSQLELHFCEKGVLDLVFGREEVLQIVHQIGELLLVFIAASGIEVLAEVGVVDFDLEVRPPIVDVLKDPGVEVDGDVHHVVNGALGLVKPMGLLLLVDDFLAAFVVGNENGLLVRSRCCRCRRS